MHATAAAHRHTEPASSEADVLHDVAAFWLATALADRARSALPINDLALPTHTLVLTNNGAVPTDVPAATSPALAPAPSDDRECACVVCTRGAPLWLHRQPSWRGAALVALLAIRGRDGADPGFVALDAELVPYVGAHWTRLGLFAKSARDGGRGGGPRSLGDACPRWRSLLARALRQCTWLFENGNTADGAAGWRVRVDFARSADLPATEDAGARLCRTAYRCVRRGLVRSCTVPPTPVPLPAWMLK